MCDTQTLVPIPDFLWQSGEVAGFDPAHPEFGLDAEGRRCLALDTCIVPFIQALWDVGAVTVSCCCGHSDGTNGVITIRTVAARERIGTMLVRVEEYDALRARADAAKVAVAECRARAEPMTAAVFRLLAVLEIENRDAAINAAIDAAEPFRRWRAWLYGQPASERGAALLEVANAMAEAIGAQLGLAHTARDAAKRWKALVGED